MCVLQYKYLIRKVVNHSMANRVKKMLESKQKLYRNYTISIEQQMFEDFILALDQDDRFETLASFFRKQVEDYIDQCKE